MNEFDKTIDAIENQEKQDRLNSTRSQNISVRRVTELTTTLKASNFVKDFGGNGAELKFKLVEWPQGKTPMGAKLGSPKSQKQVGEIFITLRNVVEIDIVGHNSGPSIRVCSIGFLEKVGFFLVRLVSNAEGGGYHYEVEIPEDPMQCIYGAINASLERFEELKIEKENERRKNTENTANEAAPRSSAASWFLALLFASFLYTLYGLFF